MLPNGGFEEGLQGWRPIIEGGGKADIVTKQPAAGRACVQLSCADGGQSWLVGPALPGQPGDVWQLSFSARRGIGKAILLINLSAENGALPKGAPIWEGVLPEDQKWHKIVLLLKTPPLSGGALPHIAFGIVGPAGSWDLDEISVQPGKIPAGMEPAKPGGEPVEVDYLTPGWQPGGYLDARVKEIAGQKELLLNVNGIELSLEPQFTCRRGVREGLPLIAVNRSEIDKELRIKIVGPPGFESPAWTVPIRGKGPAKDERIWAGTTRFHTAIQAMRCGEFWAKLIVSSGSEEKTAPLKITCLPEYPAAGILWRERIVPEALQQARRANVDLHVLAGAAQKEAYQNLLQALGPEGQIVLAPLQQSLSPQQYLSAVSELFSQLSAPFWMGPLDDNTGDSLSLAPRLVLQLRQTQPQAMFIAGPVALARDWQRGQLLPSQSEQLSAEKLAGAAALAVRPPRQAPFCILQQTIDGQTNTLNGACVALAHHTNLRAVRQLLQERKLALPLLVGELAAGPNADERLAALSLARALTEVAAQGATGWMLESASAGDNSWSLSAPTGSDTETAVQQVARLMAGELAAAVPLVPLADTPGISSEPDAFVCYKPFLRGGEGIVVLWNNTSAPKDVSIEFRFEPVVAQRLIISYYGDFIVRRWDPIMRFSEEAFKRGQPAVYIRLDPLQIQIHAFRLLMPGTAWLRKIEFTPPFKPASEAATPQSETRDWWRDMLGGRREGRL